MATPLFSIIVPTYNSANTLENCIKSILSQTFEDFEILIIDGASKDTTIEILNDFNDVRIKVFSEQDKGIYDAMNKGIAKANGEWLYFLGSDDAFYNDYVLKNIRQEVGKRIVDVIYGQVVWGETSKVYDGKFGLVKLLNKKNICHQAMFFKKRLFTTKGLFNLDYPVLADFDYNVKLFMDNSVKIFFLDLIIANYSTEGISSKSYENDNFITTLKKRESLFINKLNILDRILYLKESIPANRGNRLKSKKYLFLALSFLIKLSSYKSLYKF